MSKLLLIPVFIVVSEVFREYFAFGFPWLTFAQIYSGNIFLLNLIYYFGTNGLSYLVIFIFLFPSIIILFINQHINSYIFSIYSAISLVVIFCSLILILLRMHEDIDAKKQSLNISLVQMNIPQIEKKSNDFSDKRLNRIYEIIENNRSDLLIFAENDFPYLITNKKNLKKLSKNLNNDQSIILGGTKKEGTKIFNTLFVIDKNNVQDFDKIQLVPFGEFLPFRNFLFFLDQIVGSSDFSPGNKVRIINVSNNLNIIPIICYEIIFFNDLLNENNFNAELLVNITNDSWFGNISGPYQHFYLSLMRSVEFNKPLIRVSNNGVSAFIDNKGKIINYIPLNHRDIIHLNITISKSLPNLVDYHSLIFVLFFFLTFLSFLIRNKINE